MTSPKGRISGAWGYSPQMIAGMNNVLEYNNKPLTYQLGLNSKPVGWSNPNENPLIYANQSYYSKNNAFGRRRRRVYFGSKKDLTKEICDEFVKSDGTTNPLTKRPIKKDGPTYKKLLEDCDLLVKGPVIGPVNRPSSVREPSTDELYDKFNVIYQDCDGRDPIMKKLTLNGKNYTRGSSACYNIQKDTGTITAMGCKQINISVPGNFKEKHLSLTKFFEYNFE